MTIYITCFADIKVAEQAYIMRDRVVQTVAAPEQVTPDSIYRALADVRDRT